MFVMYSISSSKPTPKASLYVIVVLDGECFLFFRQHICTFLTCFPETIPGFHSYVSKDVVRMFSTFTHPFVLSIRQ